MPKHGTIINSTSGQTSNIAAWLYETGDPLVGEYVGPGSEPEVDGLEISGELLACTPIILKEDGVSLSRIGSLGTGTIATGGTQIRVTNRADTYLATGEYFDLYDGPVDVEDGTIKEFSNREGKAWLR